MQYVCPGGSARLSKTNVAGVFACTTKCEGCSGYVTLGESHTFAQTVAPLTVMEAIRKLNLTTANTREVQR
jgi:hypothetical protein